MLGEVVLEKKTFHVLIGNWAQADLAPLDIRNAPFDAELWVM